MWVAAARNENDVIARLRSKKEGLRSKIQACRAWITGLAVVTITLGCSAVAAAQSCSMCYNSAAAAKASAIQALKQGILILLIPPLAMFIGIFALAFRRREKFHITNVDHTETGGLDQLLSSPPPGVQPF